MHTVDFNGLPLNAQTIKDALIFTRQTEDLSGAEWTAPPDVGMAISKLSFVIKVTPLDKGDSAGFVPFSKKLFADTFCGLPIKYDWVAEPNTLKLISSNGEQVLSVINLQEPTL